MVPCRPHLVSLGRIERRKWDLLNSRCRQRARQDRCHHCRQGLPFLHGGTSLGPNGGICAHTTAVDAITCGCSTRNLLPPSWRQFFFVFVGNSEIRAFFSLCPRVTLRLGWAWKGGAWATRRAPAGLRGRSRRDAAPGAHCAAPPGSPCPLSCSFLPFCALPVCPVD
jgi:hypothetical protein